MSEVVHFQDFITIVFVIIFISIVLTLAWYSTYVRELPFVSTTVVVLQQETLERITTPTVEQNSTVVPSNDITMNQIDENNMNQIDENIEHISIPVPSSNSDLQSEDTILAGEINSTLPVNQAICSDIEKKTPSIIGVDKEIDKESLTSNTPECPKILRDENLSNESKIEYESCVRKRTTLISHKSSEEIFSKDKDQPVEKEKIAKKSCANNDSEKVILPPGVIRIRLKFLDDTQRIVSGQLSELVGNFKRANFEIELSTNCAVRLIFNGKLLNKDSSTLHQYGLFDNCVVHCYVGQPQSQPTPETALNHSNNDTDDIDLSEILSPLLLIVVVLLWYLRYEYSHIFNTSATVILVCLTALLLISQYALSITFNISLAFNNSASGNQQADNNDDSTGNPPQPAQAGTDIGLEQTDALQIVSTETEQSNLGSLLQSNQTDLNRAAPNLSSKLNSLTDVSQIEKKTCDSSNGIFTSNANIVSVS